MGMFSWVCKGCGHELKEGEHVRMNSCVGEYDGYGRAGGFDYSGSYEDPSCWHEACYQNATDNQKLNNSPSRHAPDQGFGHRALEFMEGFDPEKPITYRFVIRVDYYRNKEYVNLYYHLTSDGLKEQKEYDKAYYDYSEKMDGTEEEEWWEKAKNLSNEEKTEYYRNRQNEIDIAIGMISPERNAVVFNSLEEVLEASERELENLPNPEFGFTLTIFGTQDIIRWDKPHKLQGMVYDRSKYKLEIENEFTDTVNYIFGKKGIISLEIPDTVRSHDVTIAMKVTVSGGTNLTDLQERVMNQIREISNSEREDQGIVKIVSITVEK